MDGCIDACMDAWRKGLKTRSLYCVMPEADKAATRAFEFEDDRVVSHL